MLGTALSLALIAHPDHRGHRGPGRRVAVRLRHQARAAGRRGPRVDRRRGDLRAAAHLDAAAAAGAHAGGRVGPQRPGRRAARARADRVRSRTPPTTSPTPRCCSSRQLGIGALVGIAVGWLGVQAFRRAQLATAGLYPVASLAIAALAFGGADTLHGSGFLAVYLAGLALGSALDPRPADDHRVPPGARLGRPGRDVPHPRPARLPAPAPRHRAGGDRARADRRGGRAAARGLPGHAVRARSASASGSCSAGPACAARCRWCSRRSR